MLLLGGLRKISLGPTFFPFISPKGWFTALWNSLFILFKFHYLAKEWNLNLEFGICILFSIFEAVVDLPRHWGKYWPQNEKVRA